MADKVQFNSHRWGFRWSVTPYDAFNKLTQTYLIRIEDVVEQILEKWRPQVLAWMQANAPWQDITTKARASLVVEVEHQIRRHILLHLRHSVEYGTYLEGYNPKTQDYMINAGRWSIIEPAVDHFSRVIWAEIEAIFR